MGNQQVPHSSPAASEGMARYGARRFLSLKWKALLLTSLVLIIITGAFAALSYLKLIDQFERQRQVTHKRNAQQVAALIEQSSLRLQQIGSILTLLTGVADSVSAGDPEAVERALNQHGSMLQIDFGIDVIRLYDRSSRPIASWGAGRVDLAAEWVQKVNEREDPMTHLDCRHGCMQYALSPMLVQGRTRGVALLGASLADVMLTFNQVSGTDVALLTTTQGPVGIANDLSRSIPTWRTRVMASTNADSILPLLHSIAKQYPEIENLAAGSRALFDGRAYEIRLTPLPGFAKSSTGYLAMVDDITASLTDIDEAIRRHLTIGALALVLSEALLLALLWTPMSRLRRTALSLPLLAQGAFQEARSAIRNNARGAWAEDEIDVLDDIAVSLSYQLEALRAEVEKIHGQLETRVRKRTQQLSEANQKLLNEIGERKRVEQALAERAEDLRLSEQSLRSQTEILRSILDSMADGVIVADQDGKLLLSNPAAQHLSGHDPTRLGLPRTGQASLYLSDGVTPYSRRELPLARALRGEEVDGTEGLLRRAEQSSGTWLSANARPLKDNDGNSRGAVVVFRDITDRKRSEQRLTHLAQYDMLTGLPNRSLLHDRLSQAVARAKRKERPMALMFLDVDRFKEINDAFGHGVGDLILKGTAERLTLCLRESDTVGRLGGDEFTVILEEVDNAQYVGGVAEKIIGAFSQPMLIEEREIFVSTSVGIALYPADADTIEDMLKRADAAMYHAKKHGRNNFQFYSPQMNANALKHMSMASRLRHALEREEMIVRYQPQVDARMGKIIGVEALLSWQDAESGCVPRAQFIALAEETGLIVPIGEWVLDIACRQNKAWQNAGLPSLQVAVNLSARQLRQAQLVDVIGRILRQSGLEPKCLGLEITEGLLMEDLELSNSLLSELKGTGIQIAIDDFGTGYSSLNYLRRLPADIIKIDHCFVQNITSSNIDAAIAAAIVTLGKSLDLKVIAEGVETEQQLTVLRSQGCDFAQGYLFSPALPADKLTQLLREQAEIDTHRGAPGTISRTLAH